jgi:S-adenosyl methyltransferase
MSTPEGRFVAEMDEPRLDTDTPHSARLWNYWLGGKDNFQADRDAGDAIAGMHFIRDDEAARAAVRYLVDAMPAGSYLAIAHGCHDINTAEANRIVGFWNERGTPKIKYRSAEQIAGFFDGLRLLDPGVVPCNRWRPDGQTGDKDVNQYCGVAIKE